MKKTGRAGRAAIGAGAGLVVGYFLSTLTWNAKTKPEQTAERTIPITGIPVPTPAPTPHPATPATAVTDTELGGQLAGADLAQQRA